MLLAHQSIKNQKMVEKDMVKLIPFSTMLSDCDKFQIKPRH